MLAELYLSLNLINNSMLVNNPIADTVPAAAMSLSSFFIDVSTLPADGYGFFQLLTLGGVYGYILFNASNLISDGSELLLLVPTLAGLVGCCCSTFLDSLTSIQKTFEQCSTRISGSHHLILIACMYFDNRKRRSADLGGGARWLHCSVLRNGT